MARWGIVSTGNIAEQFANGLLHTQDAQIAAVASRSIDTARAFADKFGIKKYYGSYQQMADDPDIDIVYIGTPNSAHHHNTLLFLESGCAVVCEKPLAVNAREALTMVQKAHEQNVFFMEGIWTRFFPAFQKALEWIKDERIGIPKMVHGAFGYGSADLSKWRYSRDMAGGALMDVGIYPLSLAFAALGTDPDGFTVKASLRNGIDLYNTFTLSYQNEGVAVLSSAIDLEMENGAVICGTKGRIKIGEGGEWWHPSRAELVVYGGQGEVFDEPYASTGFQFEAAAVQRHITQGLKEAPELTLEESLRIARLMDRLRDKMGVVFDADNV